MGHRLCGRIDFGRSKKELLFKKLVEKPANGPNMSDRRPSTKRVSRCGTDIGGAPTAAWPYTLAWCWSVISALVECKFCPELGDLLTSVTSELPEDCTWSSAPPSAPIASNRALVVSSRRFSRSLTVTPQRP